MPIIRAVLLDLSGTVHIGDKMISGALEACQKLVRHNVAIRFLTNTTKSSRNELLDQLWALGFSKDLVHSDSLITNTQAAKQVIQQYNLKPYCLVQDSLLQDLELPAENDTVDFDSVLVGLAPAAFHYEKLNEAFRILQRRKQKSKKEPSAPLIIALHRGKFLRDVDGELSLGPGGFVACLQEAAGIEEGDIAVMGKPTRAFFHAAIPKGMDAAETAMIGDDVKQDVIGAKEADLGLAILVKTGKYQAGDETSGKQRPDAVVDSIVEAVDYIIQRNVETSAFST
jgi:HAD superfamily hydrolase (TIGR01458 family)